MSILSSALSHRWNIWLSVKLLAQWKFICRVPLYNLKGFSTNYNLEVFSAYFCIFKKIIIHICMSVLGFLVHIMRTLIIFNHHETSFSKQFNQSDRNFYISTTNSRHKILFSFHFLLWLGLTCNIFSSWSGHIMKNICKVKKTSYVCQCLRRKYE